MSDWSFNMRSSRLVFSDDEPSDDDDASSRGNRAVAERAEIQNLDLSSRAENVNYKPNPFSIAKINAACRQAKSLGNKRDGELKESGGQRGRQPKPSAKQALKRKKSIAELLKATHTKRIRASNKSADDFQPLENTAGVSVKEESLDILAPTSLEFEEKTEEAKNLAHTASEYAVQTDMRENEEQLTGHLSSEEDMSSYTRDPSFVLENDTYLPRSEGHSSEFFRDFGVPVPRHHYSSETSFSVHDQRSTPPRINGKAHNETVTLLHPFVQPMGIQHRSVLPSSRVPGNRVQFSLSSPPRSSPYRLHKDLESEERFFFSSPVKPVKQTESNHGQFLLAKRKHTSDRKAKSTSNRGLNKHMFQAKASLAQRGVVHGLKAEPQEHDILLLQGSQRKTVPEIPSRTVTKPWTNRNVTSSGGSSSSKAAAPSRRDAYALGGPDPDEEWSTLGSKNATLSRELKAPSFQTTPFFQIPKLLNPASNKVVESGHGENSSRRVITFLPTPMVKANEKENPADTRVNGTDQVDHETFIVNYLDADAIEGHPDDYLRTRIESSPAAPDNRWMQTDDIDEDFQGISSPRPHLLESVPHIKAKAIVNDNFERDVHRPFSTVATAKQYRQVRNVVKMKRRKMKRMSSLLSLPSCGVVFDDKWKADGRTKHSRDSEIRIPQFPMAV
ncbi:hypothetical protein FA15DRAFT_651960 [Coprinopsis marcescibilis]|uniref:Uncharacterized protein n=1 Tax=Coprinopsis marcescibilis TaxID=230819 RepID=A0A5C3L9E0_COPMA|nr:hypothetical protein FA15DRAFT_651960 [Coprinopsis marcescibilis]